MRRGDTLCFEKAPVIRAFAAVGGKREGRGPLRRGFDRLYSDNYLGQPSWEKAEQALYDLGLKDFHERKEELLEFLKK